MKKSINKAIVLAMSLTFISGCFQPIFKWNYTKEEAAEFEELTLDYDLNDRGLYKVSLNNNEVLFKDELSSSDIIFFNKTAADLGNIVKDYGYYSYEVAKDSEVNVYNFVVDQKGISFSFDAELDTSCTYICLVHKTAVISKHYVAASLNRNFTSSYDTQTSFEEKYIGNRATWNDTKTVLNIIGGVASIVTGAITGASPAIVSGVMSIINNFGDLFCNQGSPTIQDVLNKLQEMDAKLDRIENQISMNQRQLLDEEIRTQSMIDKALVELYDQNISLFNTDYVEKAEEEIAKYSDFVQYNLKEYASQNRTIDVYYKDREVPFPLKGEENEYEKYSYSLSFPNTMKYLKDNRNIVGDGFGTAFNLDIKESITNSSLARGKTLNNATADIYATILNSIQEKRYSNPQNRESIVKYKSLIINTCKRLTGGLTKSVIDSYVNRLKYMFNFAGESKDTLRSMLANLRYNLDRYVVLADSACRFAEINSKDLSEAYMDACDAIEFYYNEFKDKEDRYCFHTDTVINGDFYKSYWDVYYENPGNECKFRADFETQRILSLETSSYVYENVNVPSLSIIGEADHLRIKTRFKSMLENGLSNAKDYLTYLNSTGVISDKTLYIQQEFINRKWAGNDSYRFLTSFYIRDLTGSDTNLEMHYAACGNDSGYYFSKDWTGKYKSYRESDKWNGKMAEGVFIDARTGQQMSNKNITSFATYAESHWYWSDDEYWAFVDNPSGSCYFMLTNEIR